MDFQELLDAREELNEFFNECENVEYDIGQMANSIEDLYDGDKGTGINDHIAIAKTALEEATAALQAVIDEQ